MKALGLAFALVFLFGCSGQAPKNVARAVAEASPAPALSPVPEVAATAVPTAAPLPASTPAPAAPAIELSGALAANVMHTSTSNPCAKVGGSYYVRVTFTVGAIDYALTLTIASYGGPRTYAAPPARVSLRPVTSAQPVLYTGTSGRVVVNADERSGSLSESLESQSDRINVQGSWRCP